MVTPVSVSSIEQLKDEFDLFLFDQYGVLRDGVNTYDGMVECVQRLKAADKAVAVISNSGKRASYNVARLTRFGFGPERIERVFSSGEVAWSLLHKQLQKTHKISNVLYIGRGDDRSAIEGLPVAETTDPSIADLIVICGTEPEHYTLADYAAHLRTAAQRGTPAYCTNPDRWSLSAGTIVFGPGQLAADYESAGGQVTWIGKPYAAIYEYALKAFSVLPERVLCIGDSVEHDIAGAANAGCASLLTSTGILAQLSRRELELEYARYDASPVYMIERNHV